MAKACACGLQLGVYKLSEIGGSYYDTKYVHEAFPLNDENKSKIEELKLKSSQGLFNENIIAVPNHIGLPENDELLGKTVNQTLKSNYVEDVMHQSIINAVRNLNAKAFVMKEFQSHFLFDLINKKTFKDKIGKEEQEEKHPHLTPYEVDLIKVLSSENIDELLNKE